MSRWFRFYADAMRHPKVARLNDAQFRLWVELLSVAAEHDGHIPSADDLKHMLKRRLDHLLRGLDDLIRAGLMVPLDEGYEPHGWAKRQYKSDVSTARVRKHREKGNVSETPPETETDTDTDTRSNERVVARPVFVRPDGVDADVWADFLRNRKAKKLQNTGTAYAAFLRDLARMSADTGDPPGEVVRRCAEKGWGAIYDYRDKGTNRNGNHGKAPTGIGRTAAAALAAFPELAEHIRSNTGP